MMSGGPNDLRKIKTEEESDIGRNMNAGRNKVMVQSVLDEWEPFLHERDEAEEKYCSVYHTIFREFLLRKDMVQVAGVTIQDINKLIADRLWDDFLDKQS